MDYLDSIRLRKAGLYTRVSPPNEFRRNGSTVRRARAGFERVSLVIKLRRGFRKFCGVTFEVSLTSYIYLLRATNYWFYRTLVGLFR